MRVRFREVANTETLCDIGGKEPFKCNNYAWTKGVYDCTF